MARRVQGKGGVLSVNGNRRSRYAQVGPFVSRRCGDLDFRRLDSIEFRRKHIVAVWFEVRQTLEIVPGFMGQRGLSLVLEESVLLLSELKKICGAHTHTNTLIRSVFLMV